MAQEQVGQFGINHVSILDKDGNVDEKLASGFTKEQISEMYYYLNLLRKFDEKLFNLQRSGKIGTYAQTRGQEASEIGSGLALKENDWFVPSFRELGIYLTRGTPKNLLVQAWNGDTRALGNPNHTHNLSLSIPIASQCVHATGIAWASKIKKEKDVTIVYFGEGATSEGDFHEAMNFAAVFNLPIVFFCQRNGWSISTPTNKEMKTETIAQKAIAYGFKGIQVDGNDVLAVNKVTSQAIEKARSGDGPTLIESITYRMGDHTTSDDSLKYRSQEEINEWKLKDPVVRFEKYVTKNNILSEEEKNNMHQTIEKEINEAVEQGLGVEKPDPAQMFEDVFAKMPEMLQEQKEELLAELEIIKNQEEEE
ncbi:MAG: pyruvate dehydrogenase (acetyl-transferring) E1 component subunit alpha [Nanoarchaeales archaeon]|nr:pyruvate dehydrogenase (acetyl-transferring) E1 component subunit alpha [Nanoarchaeales archaeon]